MSEVANVVPNSVLVSFIERAARDPDFDVQKFGELLRMQREVEHDQARKAFNRAMADAQKAMPPVIRSATNAHLKNKYAKLEDLDREMRPIYTEHGFSVRFGSAPSPAEGKIRITCTVAHASGYFEENYLDAPVDAGSRSATTPVQAVGSAVTYLRRYLLGMVFNIVLADDDDDGEGVRRSAAAATPRPQTMRAAVDEDAKWKAFNAKVYSALGSADSRTEVEAIAARPSVTEAIASGPGWVRKDLSEMLADAYGRFPDAAEADADASHEPADVA